MLGLKDEYDLSQPDVREALEQEIDGGRIQRWINMLRRGVTTLENLRLDLKSVELQVDALDAQMLGEQTKLLSNISLQHELYKATEDEILELVRVIALMELVRELAQEEASQIMVNADDIAQRNLIEKRRAITDFINLLSTKITEYQNRMFIAWTSSREIMNDRTLYVGLAMKLQHQMKLTVPAMKMAMLRWEKEIEALQATEVGDVADELANEWFKAAAHASVETVRQIAKAAYTPTIKEETIDEVSQAVSREADALLQEFQKSGVKRDGIEQALARAQKLMQSKDEEINEYVIKEMVDQARNRLQIPEDELDEAEDSAELHAKRGERLS